MDKRAEEIIKNYENEKSEEILKQFNSLKPRPFSGMIFLVVFVLSIYALNHFADINVFEGEAYWFFMAVIVASGAIEGESRKINKRIDLLAKLFNANQINR